MLYTGPIVLDLEPFLIMNSFGELYLWRNMDSFVTVIMRSLVDMYPNVTQMLLDEWPETPTIIN
jgi:hypothetical protein